MLLFHFDFIITYQPRMQQGLLDTLSRRAYLVLKAEETTFNQQYTTLLQLKQFHLCTTTMAMTINSSFLDEICLILTKDALVQDIIHHSNYNMDKFKFEENFLYFEERLYILEGPI